MRGTGFGGTITTRSSHAGPALIQHGLVGYILVLSARKLPGHAGSPEPSGVLAMLLEHCLLVVQQEPLSRALDSELVYSRKSCSYFFSAATSALAAFPASFCRSTDFFAASLACLISFIDSSFMVRLRKTFTLPAAAVSLPQPAAIRRSFLSHSRQAIFALDQACSAIP